MRILITKPNNKHGGVYAFVENICPFFNMEVEIFYRGSIPNKKSIYSKLTSLITPIFFFIKLINAKPDYIIINTSLSLNCIIRDGCLVLISKLFKKKTLLIIHGFQERDLKYKQLLKVGYFMSDSIIVLAEEFKQKLFNVGYKKNIYTQYNPVSVDLLELEIAKDIHLKENLSDIKNILFLSRIEKEKGVYIAIESFERIHNQYPDIRLHIAGSGREYNNVKKLLERKKCDHIVLHNFVSGKEKNTLLKESDIFLFPTFYKEGLPINVLEAMSMGQLIITRPVGGLRDLFKIIPFGFCIESVDANDFADALLFALKNKEFKKEIVEENLRFAKANFHPEIITEKIEKILRSL